MSQAFSIIAVSQIRTSSFSISSKLCKVALEIVDHRSSKGSIIATGVITQVLQI
jgi:hypothetical protein